MTKFLPFELNNERFIQNDKSFIIIGENLYFLNAFFNLFIFISLMFS